MWSRVTLLALAVFVGSEVHAEQPEAPPGPAEPKTAALGQGGWWAELTWGAYADSVAKSHLSGGFILAKKTINPYGAPGCLFLAEPGLEAAKLSVGCGYLTVFGSTVARAVVMRTFDSPRHAKPESTYVGVEAQLPVWIRTIVRIGALRRADSGATEDWLLTYSIGYGI